ncbi:MAG: class I SAM-dependent methyltransferase [Solirubrobacteraceae bacterium]
MDYFDRIWEDVPSGAVPERFEARRDFLLAGVGPGERVLDVGCGEGAFSAALAAIGAEPVGVDVAVEPLRRARARFPELELHLVGDRLPFPADAFDVVWAGEVLEHVADGLGLLEELRRVLRPGGRLLVSTPDHPRRVVWRLAFSRAAFERHFSPLHDHVRFFTRRTLLLLLEEAGFGSVAFAPGGPAVGLLARAER